MSGHSNQYVFSYGTLQDKKVQQELFFRTLKVQKAELRGFKLTDVKIKDPEVIRLSGKDVHPGLVVSDDLKAKISGSILEVTLKELAIMDAYEVSDYKRVQADIEDKSVWVYVVSNAESSDLSL